MSKIAPYFISEVNSEPYRNCIKELQSLASESPVKVSFSRVKETRSQKLNRVMHMWFNDIQEQTGYSIIEIGGRCKLDYFVPYLMSSESDKTQGFRDVWSAVTAMHKYEAWVNMLGKSSFPSTSTLSNKEFSLALTEMQVNESVNYRLRDPSTHGIEL